MLPFVRRNFTNFILETALVIKILFCAGVYWFSVLAPFWLAKIGAAAQRPSEKKAGQLIYSVAHDDTISSRNAGMKGPRKMGKAKLWLPSNEPGLKIKVRSSHTALAKGLPQQKE